MPILAELAAVRHSDVIESRHLHCLLALEDGQSPVVRRILDRSALDDHGPSTSPKRQGDAAAPYWLICALEGRTRIRQNSSRGQSTGRRVSRVNRWDSGVYRDPRHPIQQSRPHSAGGIEADADAVAALGTSR